MLNKQLGFTLLELVITLGIISILAAVGYPSYFHYMVKNKRHRAELVLMQLAAKLERIYSLKNSYQSASEEISTDNLLPDGSYFFKITGDADTYKLTAIPQGAQAERDAECGDLNIDETGVRGISGNGSISNCWPT